jgi:hypothetical protein
MIPSVEGGNFMIHLLSEPEDWAKLTRAERVARCHLLAREAAQLAQAAAPDKRQAYRDIAAKWNTLAAEMETGAPERQIQPTP